MLEKDSHPPRFRRQIWGSALLAITITLGLTSRSSLIDHDSFIRTYAGDTLWAMALYWFCIIVFPIWRSTHIAALTLLGSFAVEFSQLYQADWINVIRSTTPGALLLGHGFLWQDLICYTTGVVLALSIDLLIPMKKNNW